ncbi:MAG: hypothetical protein KJ795_15250 [Gammaproteobacteria bacterium]|nr:hypothetical protein [Gammaproteobacteria bacterium]MBU1777840.1 hypothetical protein [Gammaproteobacteria bacterium]MBU1968534.1 hypothetical protein [Gammaproteobacteria bacterium]
MKKLLPLFCVLGVAAQPAFAANDINNLQALLQSEFRALSEDLGSALSYKPITPAEPLGITGFDMGIEVTATKMSKSEQAWKTATNSSSGIGTLYVPKLHVAKGLPLDIDVAAFYSAIPTTNIKLTGVELRYAPLPGGVATPAVAVRASYTKLSGVDQLAFDTKGLDVSISKGFAMFTPYAGVGQVWVSSAPAASTGLSGESFTQSKVFAGVNINLGMTNIALEGDKTGGTSSYGMKLGFRF